jgi:hypothetical protein
MMKRSTAICHFLVILAVMSGWLSPAAPVRAAGSFDWSGAGDGTTWEDPCNWSPPEDCGKIYPGENGPDDEATVQRTPSGPANVTVGSSTTLAKLTVGEGAYIKGSPLVISSSFSWTGGVIFNEITIMPSALFTISGGNPKKLDNSYGSGMITNVGTAAMVAGGPLILAVDASFINNGVFVIQAPASLLGDCCVTNNKFVNNGILHAVNLAGFVLPANAMFKGVALVNNGIVNVDLANLVLDLGNHVLNPGGDFGGGGRTQITGATTLISGTQHIASGATIEVTGSPTQTQGILDGKGTLIGLGRLLWTGGEIRAQLTISMGVGLEISGPMTKILNAGFGGGVIDNQSFATWKDQGPLEFDFEPKFINNGSVTASGGVRAVSNRCCVRPTAVFQNNNDFIKDMTPGTVTFDGVSFENYGFIFIPMGWVDLAKGHHILHDGGSLRGAGRLRVVAPSTELQQNTNLDIGATLELAANPMPDQSPGELSGAGSISGFATFLWTGGKLSAALRLWPGMSLVVKGPYTKTLEAGSGAGRLQSEGQGFWDESGPVQMGYGSSLINLGSMQVLSPTVLQGISSGRYFDNRGELTLCAPGKSIFDRVDFQNTGTLKLLCGVLSLDNTSQYIQDAGSTVLQGGTISSSLPLQFKGGDLRGTGVISGSLVNAATLAPGTGIGALHLTGDYTQQASGSLDLALAARPQDQKPAVLPSPAARPTGLVTLLLPLLARNFKDNPLYGEQLVVDGQAQLAGILRLLPLNQDAPPTVTFPLVSAASLSGAFSHVGGWTDLPGQMNTTSTSVSYLTLARPRLALSADRLILPPSALARSGYPGLVRSLSQAVITATLSDAAGAPLANADLSVQVTVDPTSGGHDHGAPPLRPHGWAYAAPPPNGAPPDDALPGTTTDLQIASLKTDNHGQARLYYVAPELGGMETVQVSLLSDPEISAALTLRVKAQAGGADYPQLPLDYHLLLQGQTAGHSDNHSGLPDLVTALQALAVNYYDQTSAALPVGDMALPWGGLFDLGPQVWSPPYGYHRGDTADILLSSSPADAVFESLLAEQGWWSSDPASWRSEGSHYHLALSGTGKVSLSGEVTGAAWSNVSRRILQVSLKIRNRGGLPADAVWLNSLTADSGVTPSPAWTQLNLGMLGLRQWSGLALYVHVPDGVTQFNLALSGEADYARKVFPFTLPGLVVNVP